MPTRAVSAETIDRAARSNGKNWTKAEVAARRQAADELTRREPARLRVPDWLAEDARRVWYNVIRRAKGLGLYDLLDTDALAVYCDAVAKYQEMSATREPTTDDIKLMQAQTRIIAQYADKLGLTPQSRARLVKKRADQIQDDFGAEFD